MSSVVIAGNTSGTITLAAPDVAGTTTLTLPATSGTFITTASSGQSIPKAALPTGSVLQVVNANYNVSTSSSSSTFSSSGLSASITPSSATSKIYINVHMGSIQNNNNGNGVNFRLLRNSTLIVGFAVVHGYTNGNLVTVSAGGGTTFLDSPATTSAITYSVHFAPNTNGQTVTTQANGGASSITLMEIAG